jgi:hypothetical protein
MNSFLTITNKSVAYTDVEPTSQPLQKSFDWTLSLKNLSVLDPKSFGGTCPASSSVVVFDGTRATTLDGTTTFSVALSTLDAGVRYRFTWTSGTNPTLRTDRGLTLTGQSVTVAVNANSTVNVILGGGSFTGVVAGDIVYIPGPATGDSATTPFNAANHGFWVVLAVVSSTNIQLGRPAGDSFSASGEIVVLTSNAQVQAFSAAGIQAGDNVTVSAGFAVSTRKTFVVDRVTSTWFEVLSTAAIPSESGVVPGATGMVFYTDGKRFLHLEVDQEAVAQFDGDTGESVRLSPVQAGDPRQPAWLEKHGACHKLVVVNKSSLDLNFVAHTCR